MAHRAWAWVEVFPGAPILPSPSRGPDSHGKGITFWAPPAHLSLLLQGIHIPTTRSNYSPPPPWATFFRAASMLFPPCRGALAPPHTPASCSKPIEAPSLTLLKSISCSFFWKHLLLVILSHHGVVICFHCIFDSSYHVFLMNCECKVPFKVLFFYSLFNPHDPKREEFSPFYKEETEDLFTLHPWPQHDPCRGWFSGKAQPHLCSCLPGASWALVPLGPIAT